MSGTTKSIKLKFKTEMSSVKKAGKDFKKAFEESMKINLDGKELFKKLESTSERIIDSSLRKLKEVLVDAWAELGNMLSYSKLSSANTRNLAFSYGFSASEAYGYEKARTILGFDSIEDLMYANEQETEQFTDMFRKYTDKYNHLYDQGFFNTLQRYQVEMADFQEELKMEVVTFLVDNKESIKNGMKAIMNIADFVAKIASFVLSPSSSDRVASVSDIVSNYVNKNTSVVIDNTFNNVSKNDQRWLSNAGQMTYAQIIKVLQGGS